MDKKPVTDLFAPLDARRFLALHGPNFSGRSYWLRFITGLETDMDGRYTSELRDRRSCAYIGPEVYNAISGLAPTVADELSIHLRGTRYADALGEMQETLGLNALRERNPVTLSGGEQAMLTMVCALGLCPLNLAIDSTIEQISAEYRPVIFQALTTDVFPFTSIALADNRLGEYDGLPETTVIPGDMGAPAPQRLLPIDPLDPDAPLPLSTTQAPNLQLKGLDFRYPDGPYVIRKMDLALTPGRVYTLTGRNGAGKSTLAKLLCGVLRPDAGRILLGDMVYDPWKSPGRLVGFHFQNPDLQLFSLCIDQEIGAGPVAQGVEATIVQDRVNALLRLFGLSRMRDIHPLETPFVIRKRIALAATIAMGCPWLILDEPTLGQDDTTSKALAAIVHRLCDQGFGMIIVSHSTMFRNLLNGTEIKMS